MSRLGSGKKEVHKMFSEVIRETFYLQEKLLLETVFHRTFMSRLELILVVVA